nr:EJc=low Mr zona pellucida binding protein {N-terminal} [swine, pH3 extract of ejaculated spermatozoa, Peptide Partial, 15 aa] [Sus scrofa]
AQNRGPDELGGVLYD